MRWPNLQSSKRVADTPHFSRVAFLGIGLIGSSLALAMRKAGLADHYVCWSRRAETSARARQLGVVNEAADSIAGAVAGADLVVVAVHLRGYAEVAKAMAPALAKGAIVTDVGSSKQVTIAELAPHLPDHVQLVPGHPVAGTEFSGPDAGFAELFEGRWCILTPQDGADANSVAAVAGLWRAVGSEVQMMDPAHHDVVLALTSHLPHVIAYTIVGTAAEMEGDLKSEVIQFSAGGFRDFTRIAATNPEFWRDVFLVNRDAVLDVLGRFEEDLGAIRKAIRRGDADGLLAMLTRTSGIRRGVLDAQQDSDWHRETG